MSSKGINPKGVWFVGDGLNDAPCARIVTEKGGVSCAMTSDDKTAFFTDLSLNGSLDYLFEHNKINRFLKKNVLQNQWLLAYGSIAFLAITVTFSITGIAVSPIIPLLVMASTTLFILFNSSRVQHSIDNALDKKKSWLKQLLASDLSISLLVGASMLLTCGLLISVAAPAVIAGGVSSACVLATSALFGSLVLLTTRSLFVDKGDDSKVEKNAVYAHVNVDPAKMEIHPKRSIDVHSHLPEKENVSGDTYISRNSCSPQPTCLAEEDPGEFRSFIAAPC